MESIRAVLIERLNRRIERLKKGQRRLNQLHLQDQLLDQAIARLVRVRDLHRTIGQADLSALREDKF